MSLHFQLVDRSDNGKTGRIRVTSAPRATCPITCPHRGNACMDETGPASWKWNKLDAQLSGAPWSDHLAELEAIPRKERNGSPTRARVHDMGDLQSTNEGIDRTKARQLAIALRGGQAWLYTHHPLTPHNVAAIQEMNAMGLAANASCESTEQARKAMAMGVPAVSIVPSVYGRKWDGKVWKETVAEYRARLTRMPGVDGLMCPATWMDDMDCKRCGGVGFKANGSPRKPLCAIPHRSKPILFPAHGARTKAMDAKLALFKAQGVAVA